MLFAMQRTVRACLAGVLSALAASATIAQQYPTKPIRVIMPYAAGGPQEVLGRAVLDRAGKALGQPFVIEAKPGATGNLGTEQAARAAPDGYSLLLLVNHTFSANPHLFARLPFDPIKDFTPVIDLAGYDSMLIVHPSVPANNVHEFVAHLKAHPRKYNFPSAGKGSPGHVLGEMFKLKTGTDMVHVPYKGNPLAVQSVVAGETVMMLTPTTPVTGHVRAGRLKALAIYNTDRNDDFPDLPTLDQEGISGFDQKSLPTWYGIVAPSGTPAAIVDKLNREMNVALRDPEIVALMKRGRFIPHGGTPAEFAALIKRSIDAWGKVIRETGIKGE